ncbi:MAG: hypothetical protein AB7N76_37190 [Planctomycetota bacterium]
MRARLALVALVLACALAARAQEVGLEEPCPLPQGMAYAWWTFPGPSVELRFEVVIPKDYAGPDGIYLALAQGQLLDPAAPAPDPGFYFGLQTITQGRGRGVLYSRWGTRDLAETRPAPGGWTQSSGHEGDFVGVRCYFPWRAGRYLVRLARGGRDAQGTWFGVWIRDAARGAEVPCGALRFPGAATIAPTVGSWLEVYSGARRPVDVAPWRVELAEPLADGQRPVALSTAYGKHPNTNVSYEAARRRVVFEVGGRTPRRDPAASFDLRPAPSPVPRPPAGAIVPGPSAPSSGPSASASPSPSSSPGPSPSASAPPGARAAPAASPPRSGANDELVLIVVIAVLAVACGLMLSRGRR